MKAPGTLDHNDVQFLQEHVENYALIKRIYGRDIVLKHLNSHLRIMVDAKDIRKQFTGRGGFIDGQAILVNDAYHLHGTIEVPCKVASGNLFKLQAILEGDRVNILDHVDLLLPKFQNCIGLFTFQNGIQNSPEDFEEMGMKILEKLPEKPLCIGFYNGTNGILYGLTDDLERLRDEWQLNSISVMVFRQMLATLAKILAAFRSKDHLLMHPNGSSTFNSSLFSSYNYNPLFNINSNVLWTHIAHSEAGLIANEVLTTNQHSLFQQYHAIDRFLKNHLITLTYGAVAPVPDIVRKAVNTYSEDDVAYRYGKAYSKNEDYTLKIVDTRVPRVYPGGHTYDKFPGFRGDDQELIGGDHAFSKATYQGELEEDINSLRKEFGIHECG